MAVRTVSLGGILAGGGDWATQEILTIGHWIQVIRPNAERRSAKMVKNHHGRDRTIVQFIRESVSEHVLCPRDAEIPVASADFRSSPKPAGLGLVDLSPETHLWTQMRTQYEGLLGKDISKSAPALVMRITQVFRSNGKIAPDYAASPSIYSHASILPQASTLVVGG